MDFGGALNLIKTGKKATRSGWNGKNQYIELGKDIRYTTANGNWEESIASHADIGSQAIVFVGTRGRQMGWLASQSDMLAEDWSEYNG